jgi:choline monooxygenase
MGYNFNIHPEIEKAETLPGSFYKNDQIFSDLKDKVFLKTWQFAGDVNDIKLQNQIKPLSVLENYLNEPMILTRDSKDKIHCVSNVCTHRGNIIVNDGATAKNLTCKYHGRKFELDGQFKFMPEFSDAEDFPRPCDSLHKFPLIQWGPLLFVGLDESYAFQAIINKMKERVGFLPIDEFVFDPVRSKDYLVNTHWALYCDNYLEGFHIPYVHSDLNQALDYGVYTTELYDNCNLQIGYSDDAVETFDLPEAHPDFGKHVAAYYYWVFPNMMFNFYPWGLSINIVKPLSLNRTKVSFLSYVWDESKIEESAGALLDKVEREDEFVVENVHQGLKSSFYTTGRFSPKREQGVHHFHRLLAEFMNKE